MEPKKRGPDSSWGTTRPGEENAHLSGDKATVTTRAIARKVADHHLDQARRIANLIRFVRAVERPGFVHAWAGHMKGFLIALPSAFFGGWL